MRQSNLFTASLWTSRGKAERIGTYQDSIKITDVEGTVLADLGDFMQFFGGLRDALYVGPFRNTVTTGSGHHYDINVGASFIETWHNWQTGPTKRQNNAIQAVVRDIRHIFGYQGLEIHAAKESNTLQVFADEKSYKLQELGSGIAQFIVVLGNAAVKSPGITLIDEPETSLHPSLQLDFLTSLAAYSRGGMLFATHSIGLARSGADRVYSVRPAGPRSEVTPYEATPRLAEFLGEMSFSGYQELGFSKVLLVEGSTDSKTVQQFLRMLKKDHEVLPLSLGGSGMINGDREAELVEILRITSDVSVLIDSEREKAGAALSPSRQAFAEVCRRLKLDTLVLEWRAMENYFTDAAIKGEKGPKHEALEPYDRLADASMPWAKHENWRIARRMTFDDIRATDLGKFLERL